ncbi:MAG: S1 family peptidase [Acidimicrobiales bacterium]
MRFLKGLSATLPIAAGLLVLATACGSDPPDALASIYRVEVGQCLAVENQLATAVAIAPGLVVTVAHSLDQADGVTLKDALDQDVPSELLYVDPTKDIAILRLSDASPVPLELTEPQNSGAVSVATAAGSDGPTSKPATIVDLVDATLDGDGKRAAIRLEADIKPGDSGAAVVDDDGRMVGMIFATARGEDVGWAVASSEIVAAIEALNANRPEPIALAC